MVEIETMELETEIWFGKLSVLPVLFSILRITNMEMQYFFPLMN